MNHVPPFELPPRVWRAMAIVAALVVAWLAFGCSTASRCPTPAAGPPPWDLGAFRRQGPSDPQVAKMPGWPNGWVYEWSVLVARDERGGEYRAGAGGYGVTQEDAYRVATSNARENVAAVEAAARADGRLR